MRTLIMIWLSIISIFSFRSFAGDKVLNGGNVIVCQNQTGQIKSVELLDFFEVRLNGGRLRFGVTEKSWQGHLSTLLDSWSAVAPIRAKQYKEWLNSFEQDAAIFSGISIPPIPDTGSIVVPIGCHIEPVGFQRNEDELFPGVKRYVINKDLWDQMDEIQKAGLVLHELVYREAIPLGHPSTFPTRFLVGVLASNQPENKIYFRTVSQMPLRYAEYYGIKVDTAKQDCEAGNDRVSTGGCKYVSNVEFDQNNNPVRFSGSVGPWANVNLGDVVIRNAVDSDNDRIFSFKDGKVTDISTGLVGGSLIGDFSFRVNNFSEIPGFDIELNTSGLSAFSTYESNNIKHLYFDLRQNQFAAVNVVTTRHRIQTRSYREVSIYNNPDAPVIFSGGVGYFFSVNPTNSYYTLNSGEVVKNIESIHYAYANGSYTYTEIETKNGSWKRKDKSWEYVPHK